MTPPLKPMSEFDPSKPALVHDRMNDETFDWLPENHDDYRAHARQHEPGVIEWDGLLLDGWTER